MAAFAATGSFECLPQFSDTRPVSDMSRASVVKGTARVLEHSTDIAAAEALNLKTWVPTLEDFYVEIKPSRVRGEVLQPGRTAGALLTRQEFLLRVRGF
ncbi:hypothetical protein [Pseudarthrobacter sp. NIBRBAC000502772]|uniref:hypothetical protein n=1 Tax=Pseudarthrobacter sp. NIBRBAC000502772 TaxID=2590775 RepID=UPI00143D86A6